MELHPKFTRAGVLAAIPVTCLVLLGACGSSGTPSAPPSTTAASGALSTTTSTGASGATTTSTSAATTASALSCNLVPASEINSALGVTVTGPVSHAVGSNTICSYTSASGEVLVQFNSDMTAANFAAAKSAEAAEGPTDVSGFGDQAYSTTIGPTNGLQILKGTEGLLISGPVTLAKIEALANQILSQM